MAEPQPRPCPPVRSSGGKVEGYISKEYYKIINTHIVDGGISKIWKFEKLTE